MEIPSLLRLAEHEALKGITLTGSVLDLGGDARGAYRSCVKGTHAWTTLNMDEKTKPDIFHDLEKPLPISDASYDNAMLMNVLEHIFEYRQLLSETARVVKQNGTVVIVVPFLFPVHPSPEDFHRFTEDTLRKECERAGLSVSHMTALGSGVFAARYVMLDRLLPAPLRLISFYTCRYITRAADLLFTALARALGKSYNPAHYALGYCVVAQKRV